MFKDNILAINYINQFIKIFKTSFMYTEICIDNIEKMNISLVVRVHP